MIKIKASFRQIVNHFYPTDKNKNNLKIFFLFFEKY
jgi:hypothetical protein